MTMTIPRDHVAPLPKGFITVRIMQMLFSVTIFCLSIFMHVEKRRRPVPRGSWDYGTQIEIGLSILTVLVLTYILLSTYRYPRFYNYWAILALDITFIGVWVVGFLFSTSNNFKTWKGCSMEWVPDLQDWVKDCVDMTGNKTYMAAANARWAVVGLAGSLVILWLVSFIVVTVGIARHRRNGRHCKVVV